MKKRGGLPRALPRGGQGRLRGGVLAGPKFVMATVKGDVHDIGKNIVGVVLRLQQLRSDRPGRDGARRDYPAEGEVEVSRWTSSVSRD